MRESVDHIKEYENSYNETAYMMHTIITKDKSYTGAVFVNADYNY